MLGGISSAHDYARLIKGDDYPSKCNGPDGRGLNSKNHN